MSRQLRIQFPGAIYHVMSRGNFRQNIVFDDRDREQLWQRLEETVRRYAWDLFAAALMPNHFHLFFRTPEPNLSRGMQWLLGGYGTWWNTRHRRQGHVFQGRFKAQLVENETYFWSVSRYVHRNPTPLLVVHPADWHWSTYAGYAGRAPRLAWVQYDELLGAWSGEFGGPAAADAYCRYVEEELTQRLPSPFEEATDGWLLGSANFGERLRKQISPGSREPQHVRQRSLPALRIEQVVQAICSFYGVSESELSRKGSRHRSRVVLAVVLRRHTAATLAQVADVLGLSRRDCVPNVLRRAVAEASVAPDLVALEQILLAPP